ncbi:MAG: DNA gyrase subunit A [uncultured Thermomicrobiales bacterium]|uniref:DNA gyrase subunit A n=1 Tax=uncultured Thermomicrobiales bacterium TaxID=1645740 RepID=A0A6J4VDE1_9BACT|nr:MAG: DNA gyrase subunit A [uncultured Thermomicrobiales bacterium]
MEIGNVRIAGIENEMRQSFLAYAMSVIVSRALPDARDGLKPVQRRVLYAMAEMGMRSTARYRKSAGIVGEVLKSYHPHSDTAAYDTLVRMAQDFNLRYPLVDGQGNFGSVDGDGAAAMRYTEARLAPIADELLADIDKRTVDFGPNYDASTQEPLVLPSRLPNLLINGSVGIAVGMATNIPPHNVTEICDAVAHLVDHPDATVEDLMAFVKGPDFPTGGTILGTEGIKAAYATGRGRIVIRAKAFVEEAARGGRYQIVVTELPYQVNKAALLERIADLVKEDKLDGISDLRDESDRSGMRAIIELKRDAQPMKVLNSLFKHTALQQTFGVNMVALVERGSQPRVLTLRRALQEYIAHRQEVVTRRTEFELERARRRAHVLEGLKIALDQIDAVIATIRRSQTTDTARKNLMQGFKLSEVQANAILDMRLARLAALERKKIDEEYRDLLVEIGRLEALLADPQLILGVIRSDMLALKEKYGDERRTRIQDISGVLSEEDLIPEVDVLVTLTSRGYVKRIADGAYKTQHRGGRGVTGVTMREEDSPQHILAANTMDSLLVFTNRGRVYQLKVHELPDSGRTAKGVPIVNLINLQPDETVTTLMKVKDFSAANYLFFTTRLGRVKRTSLDQFSSVRSSGLIALGIEPGDELAWVRMTDGDSDVMLITENGQAIRFAETDVRAMGRPAAGVIGIRLEGKDRVIAFDVCPPDGEVLVVAARGLGKRTKIAEYPRQGRGGKGVTAMRLTPRTGPIVAAGIPSPEDTVLMMSTSGKVVRIPVAQVSLIGRATQGVTVMRLTDTEQVASMALIAPRDEADDLRLASTLDGHDEVDANGQGVRPARQPVAAPNGTAKAPPTNGSSPA